MNKPLDLDELIARDERRQTLLRLRLAMLEAEDDLLAFARYMRPHPDAPDDADRSLYEPAAHHKLTAEHLEAVERGEIKRLIIDMPPRHGKSELATKTFVPWTIGRHPDWHTITATYNQSFAEDFGRAVRAQMQDPRFANVFPACELKGGSASASRLETTLSGVHAFIGRGGAATGRGGHLITIDDPIKDRKEADSKAIRDALWKWYTQVISSRLMTEEGRIVLIQTRWHEDDLVGRLTDPHNPNYSLTEARNWKHLRLPALAEADDPLGRKEGEPLWPKRFSSGYLGSVRNQDPRGFSALYQGRPTPDEGLFFNPEDIVEYQTMQDLPQDLRYYISSDHAVTQAQWGDKSVFLVGAVDQNNDIWIHPESAMHKLPTDQAVELMLHLMKRFKPLFWWAENGHISKSLGPFLRKRMLEEQTYCTLYEINPVKEKQQRAQSIKGRMSMGKVHFPAWTSWYQEARHQLLTFPAGAKDDFVDALSLFGLGLDMQTSPTPVKQTQRQGPLRGTLGWVKAQARAAELARRREKDLKGW